MQTLMVVSPNILLHRGDIIEYQSSGVIRQARVMRRTHADGGYTAISGARDTQPALLDETDIVRLFHPRSWR